MFEIFQWSRSVKPSKLIMSRSETISSCHINFQLIQNKISLADLALEKIKILIDAKKVLKWHWGITKRENKQIAPKIEGSLAEDAERKICKMGLQFWARRPWWSRRPNWWREIICWEEALGWIIAYFADDIRKNWESKSGHFPKPIYTAKIYFYPGGFSYALEDLPVG